MTALTDRLPSAITSLDSQKVKFRVVKHNFMLHRDHISFAAFPSSVSLFSDWLSFHSMQQPQISHITEYVLLLLWCSNAVV